MICHRVNKNYWYRNEPYCGMYRVRGTLIKWISALPLALVTWILGMIFIFY